MARFDRPGDTGRVVAGGVVSGILAGLVLSAVMAGLTVSSGGDLWSAFKGAGAPFLGERSSQPGFDAIAIAFGLIGHFSVSIGWGVLFALLVYGWERVPTVFFGGLFGALVWAGMFFVVLPLVGLGAMTEHGRNGMAILTHVIFGFALGVAFLPFQLPRRTAPPPPRMREPVYP